MQQPVMLETGCIYDLDSIQRWFETAHTCPCTRLPVNPKAIAPLPELAAEIAAWHATQQTKIPSPKHEHLSVASFPLDDAHDQPDHPPPPPGLFLNDLPLQLAQLASCTDEPSTQLQHLQHLLHRLHTPRLQPDLSVDLVRHGAVPVLTSLLLHPTTPDSICVHVADILSILSTYPGVDAMLLQAVNASNLLPQPLVFSTTKHVTKCCTVTAKTLVALVSMLDPHAPGIKQHMASTLWALWLITPWEHLRCHLVQRTKALAVLRAHVTMHLDVIQRCGVANTGALVAACHVLRSLALVRAGAEAMLSNGTLHAMRSGLHIAAGKRNRSSSGIGVDDDCDQQQQQHDAVDDHRTKIVQHHPQWHTLAATLASALANACFMLRRGGSRAGGLSRLFGVGVHAGHAAQQFCQATAVDRVTLRAVRRMMRAAMEAYATPEHPLPDVLTMHAACALLRSVTTCPLACRAALAAGLGMLVLTVGCASQDEVVCLSSTRVALVMASECGDGGKVSMGDAGGVGMAATLMASYRDDRGMLGGQLLKSLLCMATVDLYTDERVWGGLMGLLGAGGDDETAHTTAHILLQVTVFWVCFLLCHALAATISVPHPHTQNPRSCACVPRHPPTSPTTTVQPFATCSCNSTPSREGPLCNEPPPSALPCLQRTRGPANYSSK